MSLVPKSVDFEALWNADCKGPLQTLFKESDNVPIEAAPIYNTIYHLCVASPTNYSSTVYERIGGILIENALRLRQNVVNEQKEPGRNFLAAYAKAWSVYHRGLIRVDGLCMYLNKVLEKLRDDSLPDKKMTVLIDGERCEVRVRTVGAMGLNLWKNGVLAYLKAEMSNVLVKSILISMNELRRANTSESSRMSAPELSYLETSIKSFYLCDPKEFLGPYPVPFVEEAAGATEILSVKTFYEIEVELPFIAETRQFYHRESESKIESDDITKYVRFAEQRLRQEIQFAKTLFPISSSSKIISAIETELVLNHTTKLQNDFTNLLERRMESDLEIVYRLLKRIADGIEPLAKCYEDFIVKEGGKKLEEIKLYFSPDGRPVEGGGNLKVCGLYVSLLGPLLRSFTEQIEKSFENDERFHRRLEGAFRSTLALEVPQCQWDSGTLLAEFFDLLFRDELTAKKKEPTPELFTVALADGMALVRFLRETERFTETYTAKLAARLLYKLSHHGNAELSTIRALHEVIGHEAQVRLQKMIHDVSTSHRLKSQFDNYLVECSTSLPCTPS